MKGGLGGGEEGARGADLLGDAFGDDSDGFDRRLLEGIVGGLEGAAGVPEVGGGTGAGRGGV